MSEARKTNIFKIPSEGGDPVQITADEGSSPQWFENGKKIAFVRWRRSDDDESRRIGSEESDRHIRI